MINEVYGIGWFLKAGGFACLAKAIFGKGDHTIEWYVAALALWGLLAALT